MNALGMNGKLKRHGEVWQLTGASPVDFYGVLNSEETEIQHPHAVTLSPGSIIRRSIDGSSWLITATVDRTLYRRATLSRCRHLASISRTDATSRDTFGRSTATEPQVIAADVPLLLVSRSVSQDAPRQDRATLVWTIIFQTASSYEIRPGDIVTTATLSGTVQGVREITPGILEIHLVS